MRSILALLAALVLVGCGHLVPRQEIDSGRAELIPGSVFVSSFGQDFKVHGIVQVKGTRLGLETFATDCVRGIGSLRSTGVSVTDRTFGLKSWVTFPNLIAEAGTPPDRIFHDMCDQGLPLVQELATSESDEDRAKAEAFFNRMRALASRRSL